MAEGEKLMLLLCVEINSEMGKFFFFFYQNRVAICFGRRAAHPPSVGSDAF
jgi:hypothetical protein